jgi:hypothetical protein
MNKFHLFTLIISSIVFLGLFIYSAIIFYTSKKRLFPPDMAPCPDNWKMNADGTCKIPALGKTANLGYLAETGVPIYVYKNIGDTPTYSFLNTYFDPIDDTKYDGEIDPKIPLGYYTKDIPHGYSASHPESGSIDFTDSGWATYGDPYCTIKKWAKTQNIQWDGMASYDNGC